MANNTVLTRIKLRSKTSDEWELIKDTDVPLDGEYCIVKDLNKSKIGNGSDTFYNLPWHNITPEELEEMQKQVEENALYTTTIPTVNAFGGIPAGWTCEGMSVAAVLDQLLHPWVAPSVSASTSPNGGVREKGDAVTISSVDVTVTPKSSSIAKIEIYYSKDVSTPLTILTEDVSEGGIFNIPFNGIELSSDSAYFTANVLDGADKVTSKNTGAFTFVYPYYYGAIDVAVPISDDITTLTKKVETKGNKTYVFTADNRRPCFAYPASYGNLKNILDANGFDVTDTFNLSTLEITGLDGTAQQYNVYTLADVTTVSAFNFTFQY